MLSYTTYGEFFYCSFIQYTLGFAFNSITLFIYLTKVDMYQFDDHQPFFNAPLSSLICVCGLVKAHLLG